MDRDNSGSSDHVFWPPIKASQQPAFTVTKSGTLHLGPPPKKPRNLQEHYAQIRDHVHHLGDSAVQRYGHQLMKDINDFYAQDSLSKAHKEGRLVYRSWPQDPGATNSHDVNKQYTSGFQSLATTRDPVTFRQEKTRFKNGQSHDPLAAAPATLLSTDPSQPVPLWSGSGPGMVTALLPEEFYVRFEAFNSRTKQRDATQPLRELGSQMRAQVTRPVLFDNRDLSSGIMTLRGKTKRYGKPSMGSGDPNMDKMSLGRQAQEYQSFIQGNPPPHADFHNEIAVKFRQTGLYAPALELTQQQRQHTRSVPDLTLFGKTITTKQVTESLTVIAPENLGRNTHGLGQVLGNPQAYPVLKSRL
ncbi:MAG: hypothetical protein COX57_02820 [Alphaproteobacteria bacterium CG_4_10_14_0_2_um_filter_63_37]|nr:MAG: hypothetical protein AUJ55_03290 [Proteobacteria bacterium CG1_02_64_396]PJA25477.1 MAG: hypothetical protein COX57_02820 [Alphaproteobacteria bacterium CG_4_10_14_0_2_um_filter_63_37]